MIDLISDMSERSDAFSRQVHQNQMEVHRDQMEDKRWMREKIDQLSEGLRPAFKDAAAPVGRSCRTETIWPDHAVSTEIDEPTAQVLRSASGLELGDLVHDLPLRIRSLSLDTGTGRAEIVSDDGRPVKLRITDPALAMASNVYSRALDTQTVLSVTAKPTLKAGVIDSLFVSDGRLDR